MPDETSPFHAGEREAQCRAGVGDTAAWARGFIRDHMPEQHRKFFAGLPFLVIASGDGGRRPWVSILEGPDGFISTPAPNCLRADAQLEEGDPLARALAQGTSSVGLLGIDLATRRRNRMNGRLRATTEGLTIEVQQSFGNCPSHIHERTWHRTGRRAPAVSRRTAQFEPHHRSWIGAARTFFIGSGFTGSGLETSGAASTAGYDASHRGGPEGCVRVDARGRLHIPDYAGNRFFNTIGNLLRDARVGLLFVDFPTGSLLHITGRAEIDWEPHGSHDPNARRMIIVTVDEVIERPEALSLRWRPLVGSVGSLKVVDKVIESDGIASFHFASMTGEPLSAFKAGQHLPVELPVPGQRDRVRRTYSLSGAPDGETYRITVKREAQGLASRFLHDQLVVGDEILAGTPSGGFLLPAGHDPVVLVSAGVGVTPVLSMLHDLVQRGSDRAVWFVHGARNGAAHAFRKELATMLARHDRIERRVFYSAPTALDILGRDFDQAGRVTARDLLALRAGAGAQYMLCGPAQFLADIGAGLEAGGVSSDHIHFETFGPAG